MTDTAILIVEDEAIVAEDLAGKVRQLGYAVLGPTATGEEAVGLARRQQPALVLMDIHLTGAMDGIEAAREIHRACNLPVLFLTAHSDAGTLKRARQVQAFGYILKPFDERDLRIQIEMALYKHAAEQRLREREERLAGINQILQAALSCATEADLAIACLAIAGKITQSQFGFIGDSHAAGPAATALSHSGWEACSILDSDGRRAPPGSFTMNGSCGPVILNGEGWFTNEPALHCGGISLPDTHPPLQAFLGVPMLREGRVVGVLGVCNREGGYCQTQLDSLEALAPSIVEAFMRLRAEAALRLSYVELQVRNDALASFNNVAVGRELRMIELKEEINALCANAGLPRRYRLEFREVPG